MSVAAIRLLVLALVFAAVVLGIEGAMRWYRTQRGGARAINQRLRLIGMRREPRADGRHRDLVGRDFAAFGKQAADRHIGLAVLAGIADAGDRFSRQADPAGALHLQEERVRRVRQPKQFQVTIGQRAGLDLRPIVVGY